MGFYIYESHLGGLYTNDEYLDYDYLYCEDCGDSDRELGYVKNRKELINLLEEEGYNISDETIKNFLKETFPTKEEKKQIKEFNKLHKFPRKPKVENKYNLTPKLCRNLKIVDVSYVEKHYKELGFWRNNVIDAWCISKGIIDENVGWNYADFWIGFYDENAKAYKGKVVLYFNDDSNTFKEFFNFKEIHNRFDLEIQEMFLEIINDLLDKNILYIAK